MKFQEGDRVVSAYSLENGLIKLGTVKGLEIVSGHIMVVWDDDTYWEPSFLPSHALVLHTPEFMENFAAKCLTI